MAANLDKAESSLTTVSDLSYIRGIDSSGNSVKISKSDLASVLGAVKSIDNIPNLDCNTVTKTGIYQCLNNFVNAPFGDGAWGSLLHFQGYYSIQLYCGGSDTEKRIYIRYHDGRDWIAWHEILRRTT